jgi:putative tricarboxylic transport membrane protein
MIQRPESGRSEAEEVRPTPVFPPRGDVAVALVILLVAGILYALTWTFEDAPRALSRGMQPREFPQLVLGLIAFLALLILFRPEPLRSEAAGTDRRAVALTVLACIVCVLLFEHLGVLLTLMLFGAFLPIAWKERRYLMVATYAIVFPLVIWGLFRGILGVHFPGPFQALLFG